MIFYYTKYLRVFTYRDDSNTSRLSTTYNSFEKIIQPLLSRFLVLEIPEYTFDEFKNIVVYRLKTDSVDKVNAMTIAEKVWNELDSKDIRDAIKVGRLANNVQEVENIVGMMKAYSREHRID